jgi:hypothetical protein
MIERRQLLRGLGLLIAAPAIVRVAPIMRINPTLIESSWHHVVTSYTANAVPLDGTRVLCVNGEISRLRSPSGSFFSMWFRVERVEQRHIDTAAAIADRLVCAPNPLPLLKMYSDGDEYHVDWAIG